MMTDEGHPSEYRQDGPEARRIASVIPYYPFHGKNGRQFYCFTHFIKLLISILYILIQVSPGSMTSPAC